MNIIEIIEKKKRAEKLTEEEIRFFIEGIVNGSIADYQSSALLMAICINGMDYEETFHLTMAMAYSGDVVDMSSLGRTVLDKHSTGGVGDKTTLIVGPIMAALGVPVGKMSGRGLGITGGTIDKLDSIPGFSSSLDMESFMEHLKTVGFVDAAQTLSLAPADKILYALRDVTGTVESLPLIASSIMSKKLASGADAIVLDVKCGSGAFMKDYESAVLLANTMIDIGKRAGRKTVAVVTDMNEPLGYSVGNVLEVYEAAEFLKGTRQEKNLKEVVVCLCSEMYRLSDVYKDGEDSVAIVEDVISSGKAYEKFIEFVRAQGGDFDLFQEKFNNRSVYNKNITVKDIMSEGDSFIFKKIDAGVMGRVSLSLGAGRLKKEDDIDMDAGIVFDKKMYDVLSADDSIATLYSSSKERIKEAEEIFLEGIEIVIGDEAIYVQSPILKLLD
ncbi:pyrimidine-nucleoside phosphorylase [Lachnospiraceae bacterium]|nr:pyrimidine-nucleoside phosphorylase [Lachnospiraceae bacterium]